MMLETREQIAARSRQLIPIVDEMFKVCEAVHGLLCQWHPSYHHPYIAHLMKLQQLEADLVALGFEDEFAHLLLQNVYDSVFGSETSN